MMIQAGLNQQDKRKFLCDIISTATKLDIIMVRTDRTKPPYTLFFNKAAKYMKHLISFGDIAVVAIHEVKKMRPKLDTRGKTSMFVGYADDHARDVYRFINMQSKKVILSRDTQWLNLFWKHYKMRHNNPRRQQVELFLDGEENLSLEGNDPEENRIEGDGNNTIEKKRLGLDIEMIGAREETLGRTRSQTQEMFSPRNKSMERAELTMEDWIQETCLISAVTQGQQNPKHPKRRHSPAEKERDN